MSFAAHPACNRVAAQCDRLSQPGYRRPILITFGIAYPAPAGQRIDMRPVAGLPAGAPKYVPCEVCR